MTKGDGGFRPPMFGILALGLLGCVSSVAGCVSAVDDTTAFGFNDTGTQAANAGTPADDATSKEAAVASADTDAAAKPEKDPTQTGSTSLVTQTAARADASSPASASNDGSRSGIRSLFAQKSVAAYAGDAVEDGAAGKDGTGGKSLFTSLFTDSKVHTPIANAERNKSRRVILQRSGAPTDTDDALPGVDPKSLFEIGQRNSADDEDIGEDQVGGSYQVASLSGLSRLAPNGLLVQRDDVQTACFPRDLVSLLHQIEYRFSQKVIVTSGYRDPNHNRRVHGAMRSQHLQCKAADIIVPNTDSKVVANYVRSLPNRGGVGTYCHTTSIHIDVGPKRDWNWSCRQSN